VSELHVVFKVGGAEYLLPASDVLQMESYAGATPVPGAPRYVAGIVQIRGRIVPVVDLRARFGLTPAERTIDSRLVVGRAGARVVALLVDSAREVVKIAPDALTPAPARVATRARGLVTAVARVDSRLLMLLDFERLIGEEGSEPHGAEAAGERE
jgi:purine-binding chemotaxis protein CheW